MSHIMMFSYGQHVGTIKCNHEAHDRYMLGDVDGIRVIQNLDEEPHVITREPYPTGWITRPQTTPDFMAGREVNFSTRRPVEPSQPAPMVLYETPEERSDEEKRTPQEAGSASPSRP